LFEKRGSRGAVLARSFQYSLRHRDMPAGNIDAHLSKTVRFFFA